MTTTHPLSWLRPYWQRFHGLDRPVGPTDDDALAVLAELGVVPEIERFQDSPPWHDAVPFIRRRLCLPPERDHDVAAAVDEFGVPAERTVATAWWDGT
jgi:hypothetical protein